MQFKLVIIIFYKIKGCVKGHDGSMYLILSPSEEKDKDVMKNCGEMFDKIKYLI